MRWAFWRTAAYGGPLEPDPLPRDTWSPAGDEVDPDDEGRAAASSGARPDPDAYAGHPAALGAAAGLDAAAEAEPYPLDAAGIRAELLALVQAAEKADRDGSAAVLDRLTARGSDEPGVASLTLLGLLGDRLLVAAGRTPWDEPPEGSDAEAALAQGDTLAHRAGPLLRAVAPDSPPDLVRSVVIAAAGAGDRDRAVTGDVPVRDVLLVTAVLLAQSVRDDGGADELVQALEELLPG